MLASHGVSTADVADAASRLARRQRYRRRQMPASKTVLAH